MASHGKECINARGDGITSEEFGMRRSLSALIALALVAGLSGSALAAPPCKDATTGKFIKCPPPAPAPVTTKCRDKTTKKFAKCSAPNTEPVPVKAPS
jgi:hypothetical protein